MRFALSQVNPTVGDIKGNAALVLEAVAEARRAEAHLVAFPELVLSGYPPEDLLLKNHFVQDCEETLAHLARSAAGVTLIVGTPLWEEGRVYNAAAVLSGGRVAGYYRKIRLPNYAVFDEDRYFTAGDGLLLLDLAGGRVAVNICEDIWLPCGPTEEAALVGGAQAVVNISMSPYHSGKGGDREAMLRRRALDSGAYIIYVNGVGGQDELVFDGHSLVFGPTGDLLARGPQFEEALVILDLDLRAASRAKGDGRAPGAWPARVLSLEKDLPGSARADLPGSPDATVAPAQELDTDLEMPPGPPARSERLHARPARLEEALSPLAEIYAALVLGVRDYVTKNGFRHVVLGMSGGIDSALTGCIAADALSPEAVTAVSMPSRYSSPGTHADARLIAERLGVEFLEISIEPVFEAYVGALADAFSGQAADEAEENLQARIRGNYLMALSNKFGWLVLTTGNKSEMAVGYSTLYGDMAGGFAVIKDVPKTLVYLLSEYRNSLAPGRGPIPQSIIDRAPSAELRPDQTDQDTLPPYDLLDRIIEAYVVRDESVEEMVAAGLPAATVERIVLMIDRNEYKRRQAPPGPRITGKAFGKDRRLPITNAYRG